MAEQIQLHACHRISARTEDTDDHDVGDESHRHLKSIDQHDHLRGAQGQLADIISHVKNGDQRRAAENDGRAGNDADGRDDHGKTAGIHDSALDLAGTDRLADHDTAGVAEADEEYECNAFKGLVDGTPLAQLVERLAVNQEVL